MSGGHDLSSGTLALPSTAEAAASPDVLSDVLHSVRLTGALFFAVDASSPWVARAPSDRLLAPILQPGAQRVVSYHVVREGRCWCEVEGEPAIALEAGDVVVVPHGDAYALSDAPGARAEIPLGDVLEWFRLMAAGELPLVSVEGGGGAGRIQVICGFLVCDVVPFNPVLATLPRVLHVRRAPESGTDRLAPLIEFLAAEAESRREGRRSVLIRIGELLFVEVVRRHVAALGSGETGWLAGLRDPLVGRALALLHGDAARPWTLEALASRAGCSRSALAERFARLVGQPPMQYLTRWRLQRAARLLASEGAKVSTIAREVGYDSEAAFSRAFKRLVGRSPAEWRRSSRSAPAAGAPH
jgi:AraC-like DNA-binding protein